jgi:hypothetical protein
MPAFSYSARAPVGLPCVDAEHRGGQPAVAVAAERLVQQREGQAAAPVRGSTASWRTKPSSAVGSPRATRPPRRRRSRPGTARRRSGRCRAGTPPTARRGARARRRSRGSAARARAPPARRRCRRSRAPPRRRRGSGPVTASRSAREAGRSVSDRAVMAREPASAQGVGATVICRGGRGRPSGGGPRAGRRARRGARSGRHGPPPSRPGPSSAGPAGSTAGGPSAGASRTRPWRAPPRRAGRGPELHERGHRRPEHEADGLPRAGGDPQLRLDVAEVRRHLPDRRRDRRRVEADELGAAQLLGVVRSCSASDRRSPQRTAVDRNDSTSTQ